MVAYGFKPSFVAPIAARTKRQTIRLPRKRHARVGEPVQLFSGLRTRSCAKIIPDPVCIRVDEVVIDLREATETPAELAASVRLFVNGIPVVAEDADAYAIGDGFPGLAPFQGSTLATVDVVRPAISPFRHMARWWLHVHGRRLFEGVAICWEDRA